MNTNNCARLWSFQNIWLFRAVLASILLLFCLVGLIHTSSIVHADAVPGGNIANPVVRAVDVAKPAVVRIITTIGGRLTVHFPTSQSADFPLDGGMYKLKLSGSGAFISAHGDILTADHVITPPHDQGLDTFLQEMAAQDIADYVNRTFSVAAPYTKYDVMGALQAGYFGSQSQYGTSSSEVYLSTDYIGTSNPSDWAALPADTHAVVDKVEMESSFKDNDLAIIHVKMNNTPSIQLGDSSDVAQQDELTIIGFPGNADLSDPAKPVPNDMLTASVNKLYVSAIKNGSGEVPLIEVGGNVEHGDSGGPALDHDGKIVGIVSFGNVQDLPAGTSFLRASNNAYNMVRKLLLDTAPGSLQKAWGQAMSDYASTAPGHWHKALHEFQQITVHSPLFLGVDSYLGYANTQAAHERLPGSQSSRMGNLWSLIAGGVAAAMALLIVILAVVFFVARSRKKVAPAGGQFMVAMPPMVSPSTPVLSPMTQAPLYEPVTPVPQWQGPVPSAVVPPPPSEMIVFSQERTSEPLFASIEARVDTFHMVEQQEFDSNSMTRDALLDLPTEPTIPVVNS